MGRHLFPHHVEEVVAASFTQELELRPQVHDSLIEACVGTQVGLEVPVLVVKIDDPLRVVYDRRQLAPVANDPGVLRQLFQIRLRQGGDRVDIESA